VGPTLGRTLTFRQVGLRRLAFRQPVAGGSTLDVALLLVRKLLWFVFMDRIVRD
jgi:hypothetical protein